MHAPTVLGSQILSVRRRWFSALTVPCRGVLAVEDRGTFVWQPLGSLQRRCQLEDWVLPRRRASGPRRPVSVAVADGRACHVLTDAGKTDFVKLVPVPSSPRVSFRLTLAQLLRPDLIGVSIRATGVTAYSSNVAASLKMTKLYGRPVDTVTVDEIQRIVIRSADVSPLEREDRLGGTRARFHTDPGTVGQRLADVDRRRPRARDAPPPWSSTATGSSNLS